MPYSCAIILQARLGSERLPAKIIHPIAGIPLLKRICNRMFDVFPPADLLVIASSTASEKVLEDQFGTFFDEHRIQRYYGDEENVLSRFAAILETYHPETCIRATGDNPFLSRTHLVQAYQDHLEHQADITIVDGLPTGCAVEILRSRALLKSVELLQEDQRKYEGNEVPSFKKYTEHVTPYIYDHPHQFAIHKIPAQKPYHRPDIRLTLDEPKDLEMIEAIFTHFELAQKGIDTVYSPPLDEVIRFLDDHPEIKAINQTVQQKKV